MAHRVMIAGATALPSRDRPMTRLQQLFRSLDGRGDGVLSRDELREAALRLGWHWHEAPLYAVLDALTLREPLSEVAFHEVMGEILRDRHGPYGEVLRRVPRPPPHVEGSPRGSAEEQTSPPEPRDSEAQAPLLAHLETTLGLAVADEYRSLLHSLAAPAAPVRRREAALLLIDPQRSFTSGVWARSAGQGADVDVAPLRIAFAQCARRLEELGATVELGCTRCPFPPRSYEWDERIGPLLVPDQPYFVKPGNSALWPPTNGCSDWFVSLLERGKRTVVIAGCTLNSCVRVTAVQARQAFARLGLKVLVDLSLCGARTDNYEPSPNFGGRSSVRAAVDEMSAADVLVAARVTWR